MADDGMCMHPDPLTGTLPTLWEKTMAKLPTDDQPDRRLAPSDDDDDRKPARDLGDDPAREGLKVPIIKPK
jgi:hypothetical protein